jgi:ADP-ribose pyrophosphatase YjhB (NUDIX family)
MNQPIEQSDIVFDTLHVCFIEDETSLPKREDVSAIFLIGFIEGKIVAARNERGWDVPGGHVEAFDDDLIAALRRESAEEACMTFGKAVPFATLQFEGKDNECQLMEFISSDDAFERDCMTIPDFIEKYNWKKNVIELLINKAVQVLS